MTTATMPDRCPRCGAVVVGDYHLFLIGGEDFVCGTIIVRQGDRRVEARRLAHRILTTVQTTETLARGEGCAMDEVEAVLGVEVPDDA